VAGLTFVNWQEPIGCGGVAVFPGDVIVADDDGAVVIPANLAEEVAVAGVEQERLEAWIMREVEKGAALPGLYPMNAETKARYEAQAKPEGRLPCRFEATHPRRRARPFKPPRPPGEDMGWPSCWRCRLAWRSPLPRAAPLSPSMSRPMRRRSRPASPIPR
jgi:hypothetical protein